MCLFLVSLVNKLTWFLEEEKKIEFFLLAFCLRPPACVHRARGEEMLCHCWHCVCVVVEENTFTSRLIRLFCELIVQNHERRFRMQRGSGETTLGLSEKFQMRTSKWFLRGRRIKKKVWSSYVQCVTQTWKIKVPRLESFFCFFLRLLNKRLPVL